MFVSPAVALQCLYVQVVLVVRFKAAGAGNQAALTAGMFVLSRLLSILNRSNNAPPLIEQTSQQPHEQQAAGRTVAIQSESSQLR